MARRTPNNDSRDRDGDDSADGGAPGGVMTFGEHLEELRRRLILALSIPLPIAVLAFVFADTIRQVMTAPLYSALEARRLPTQVQALSPVETLTTDLFLAVILALVLSAPWLVFQLWKFVEPGLYASERRFAHFLMPASGVLVAIGLSVLYWVMLPLMLLFLVGFGQPGPTETFPIGGASEPAASTMRPAVVAPSDPAAGASEPSPEARPGTVSADDATTPPPPPPASLPILDQPPASLRPGDAWIDANTAQLRVVMPVGPDEVEIRSATLARDRSLLPVFRLREYVNFVLLLALAISIAFQLPLVILLLGWVGIVDVAALRRHRKYALLACAVVAAVLTPPDFISMFLLLGPLYGLYELGILLLVALPPERLAQGSIVHDTFDRLRRWRRGGRDAPESAATPPPPGVVPRGADPFDDDGDDGEDEDEDGTAPIREPDGDADEDSEIDPNAPDPDDGDDPRRPGGASGGPPR